MYIINDVIMIITTESVFEIILIPVAIVVLQGATVGDLMKAIEKSITRKCLRSGQTTRISWYEPIYWLPLCSNFIQAS